MSLGKQETNNKTNKTQRSTTELGVFQVASLWQSSQVSFTCLPPFWSLHYL